jgi:hypothetical protein
MTGNSLPGGHVTISPPRDVDRDAARADAAPRPRRWARWLAAVLAVVVVAVVVVGELAAHYQPLEFGDGSGGDFPGLPPTPGARTVDSFGGQDGVVYIPPQPGAFTVSESITNSGSRPVTILAARLLPPGYSFPVVGAGPSMWMPMLGEQADSGQPVTGLVLRPHQDVRVGIPVRMTYPCLERNVWSQLDSFYVHERFLTFTRWVRLPLGMPITMREPQAASTAGSVC